MNEEIEAMVPLSDAKLHAYLEDGGSLWSHLDVENMAGELLCARDLLGRLASDKEAMRAERDEALASATFERTVANEWLAQLHDARRERDEARGLLGRIGDWTHQFGAALCPTAGSADSFGDGMREAKRQVATIVAAHLGRSE